MDKSLTEWSLSAPRYAEQSGATLAAIFSFLLVQKAQTEPTDPTVDGTIIVANATMRTTFSIILILTGILILMLSMCMFKEVSIERRMHHKALKRQLKDADGIEFATMQRIDCVALAGSDEWIRMKDSPPD